MSLFKKIFGNSENQNGTQTTNNQEKVVPETKTLQEILSLDFNSIPDETFFQMDIERLEDGGVRIDYLRKFELLSLFTFTYIEISFYPKSNGKIINIKSGNYENSSLEDKVLAMVEIKQLVNTLYSNYGTSEGKGAFTNKEENEIINGYWCGRHWTDDKTGYQISIEKEGNAVFVISILIPGQQTFESNKEISVIDNLKNLGIDFFGTKHENLSPNEISLEDEMINGIIKSSSQEIINENDLFGTFLMTDRKDGRRYMFLFKSQVTERDVKSIIDRLHNTLGTDLTFRKEFSANDLLSIKSENSIITIRTWYDSKYDYTINVIYNIKDSSISMTIK